MKSTFAWTIAVLTGLAACAPARPVVPPGQLGLVMDMTAFNKGQCEVQGANIAVEKTTVLGGDYFKVVGDLLNSSIVCIMPNGQRVGSVSHRQFYDQGGFDYAAIIIGRVQGVGDVEIYGYNDGPNGKVDVEGFFVFDEF